MIIFCTCPENSFQGKIKPKVHNSYLRSNAVQQKLWLQVSSNKYTYIGVWSEVEMLKQYSNNQVDNSNNNTQRFRPGSPYKKLLDFLCIKQGNKNNKLTYKSKNIKRIYMSILISDAASISSCKKKHYFSPYKLRVTYSVQCSMLIIQLTLAMMLNLWEI